MPRSKAKTKSRSPSPRRAATKRRRYTDEFRAQALACLQANAGNVKRTAKQLGIPEKTLEGWHKGTRNPVHAELRDKKTGELKDVLDAWVREITSIPVERFPELSLQQAGVAVGIAVDKIMLLTGRPTVIDESRVTGKVDLDRLSTDELLHLAAIKAKAEGRQPIVVMPQALPGITVDDGAEDDEDATTTATTTHGEKADDPETRNRDDAGSGANSDDVGSGDGATTSE